MKRFLPALILLLTSCELMVDVDIPDTNANRLVTNAIQNPDSTWTVRLTRSNHILSLLRDTFFPVDYADVIIHNPDGSTEALELVKPSSGTFKGKTYPQPGQTYKITISARGLEAVEAEMTMPSLVPIVKIEFDSTEVQPRGNRFFYSVYLPFTLTINDPPGEKNFYKVEAYSYKRIKYGPPGQPLVDTVASRSIVTIEDPALATEEDRRQRFTDETFDGTTFKAQLATSFYTIGDQQELLYFEIRFVSMSREYFRYEESAELSSDVMGDPFAQPVQVYSNVSNGFGIFAGGSYDIRGYNVKQEP